jgi:hypothetical protein
MQSLRTPLCGLLTRGASLLRSREEPRTRCSPLALSLVLGLGACSGHHTSDEVVVEDQAAISIDAGVDDPSEGEPVAQAPKPTPVDAGSARDASAAQCNETDVAARLLCTAGLGGAGIDQIITGILGGGMQGMSCAKETDPIALVLCGVLGQAGSGVEGLIGTLLGDGGIGSLLSDGGIERVITNTLVEVTRGLIDDLLATLFGGLTRDAGSAPRADAGARNRAPVANAKGRDGLELVRSPEECAAATSDDLVTRLVCARQALDVVSQKLAD